MPQYDVHWLGDQLVLDCQSNFVDMFESRLTVPLLPLAEAPEAVRRLMPTFAVDGGRVVMATPLAAAVQRRELGRIVTSLAAHRDEISAALDFLLTGF